MGGGAEKKKGRGSGGRPRTLRVRAACVMEPRGCSYPHCAEEDKINGLKPCDTDGCSGEMHHFCLAEWCVMQTIPELPAGERWCWSCINKRYETTNKPIAAEVVAGSGDTTATAPLPPAVPYLPEAGSGRIVEWEEIEAVGPADDGGGDDAPEMRTCPRCAQSVMACMLASHMELCTAAGDADAAGGTTEVATTVPTGTTASVRVLLSVLADFSVCAKLSCVSAHVETLDPTFGTRCSWDGRSCIIWCAIEDQVSILFDDMKTEWQTVSREEFAAKAVVLRTTAAADSIDHVLIDKKKDKASNRTVRLPSGMLNTLAISENGWQAFLSYRPVPDAIAYADPILDFPIGPGQQVQCSPPFVSIPKGANVAPMPMEDTWTVGVFCGVLIGDEYNSTKGKTEQRRWALVVVEGTECLMPLAALTKAAPTREEQFLSREECIAACKRAAGGRKPGSLQTMFQSAKHRRSLLLPDDMPRDITPVLRGGLRARRLGTAYPLYNSPAAAPSPAAALARLEDGEAPISGIPLQLHGWGETKLLKQKLSALQLALAENNMTATAAESRSKAALIRILLKRYATHVQSAMHMRYTCTIG